MDKAPSAPSTETATDTAQSIWLQERQPNTTIYRPGGQSHFGGNLISRPAKAFIGTEASPPFFARSRSPPE